jgi:hypothetical protein
MTVVEKIEAIEEFLKDSSNVLNCPSISSDPIRSREIHLSMIDANEQLKKLRRSNI